MGAVINPSASTPEALAVYHAEERAAMQRLETARMQQEAARAAEDRYLKDNPQPPPPGVPVNYYNDLWSLTAPASTNEGHIPHPEIPGATSAQLHASPRLELKDRDWAAQQNAQLAVGRTPEYHPEAPVVVYSINLTPTDLARVHGDHNPVGPYATRPVDINNGHMSAEEIAHKLSIPRNQPLPTKISDVEVGLGTSVEASRPISGEARQIKIRDLGSTIFLNTRNIG
jgi:hypothetical protein